MAKKGYFPLLIQITEPSGLEGSAIAGKDYDEYLVVETASELPQGISFIVLQTNFTGKSVNSN